ncbi:MAG TPA: bifunctional diaminohydroxyphosphoribosylaminopyrimidine deaminase/5-amino-6-(5-phosphoribosylamino)uracil reductase RibD [Tepidisphaeraceae bacterium]|nr:bifunctional diaminohydroxyphosphoribosylaminopyrimidine deaminase/5-amino-6-(5-phosphoribosylamino)uracil reductase RibD [Tepidisphaeraceae bacterium]
MTLASDEVFMRRAIELAGRGRGAVEPNPMVGCVIVQGGRVIGEGYHRRFGGPHAEREALAACVESPAGATAFVTLEPCCHTNKKTPPCVPGLIEAGISRVVIACLDPNPQVAGGGVSQLSAAGVRVESRLLEAEAKQLIAPFFARMVHHRPYVTLKWAQSADGKVAGPAGQRRQISNSSSMRLVHELRARGDAILVGIGTALADDPLLTARKVTPCRPLIRCVVDSHLRLPAESKLANTTDLGPVVVYCGADALREAPGRADALRGKGVEIVSLGLEGSHRRLSLREVLGDLYRRQVTHLLIEPGPTLARSLLQENLADRIWVFRSPVRIDSPTAPAAAGVDYPVAGQVHVDGDVLTEYLNPASDVFYRLEPSVDLKLALAGASVPGQVRD